MAKPEQTDWSRWSAPQIRALMVLWFAVPMHQTVLAKVHRVRGSTLLSLLDAGLVREICLSEHGEGRTCGMPFWCLTRQGQAVRRDYIRWHRRLKESLGSLPPSMAAIAEASDQ